MINVSKNCGFYDAYKSGSTALASFLQVFNFTY